MNKIIILKTYYDALESKISNNNIFSPVFKLKRGVKQGEVLSGNLFNFYINEFCK